jgi:cytochrome c553
MVLATALAVCSAPAFPCLAEQPAAQAAVAGESPVSATHVLSHLESSCLDCHDADTAEGKLAIPALGTDLSDTSVREKFALMHDRVAKRQMPPDAADLPDDKRAAILSALSAFVEQADRADISANGRVPLRRLNRR